MEVYIIYNRFIYDYLESQLFTILNIRCLLFLFHTFKSKTLDYY